MKRITTKYIGIILLAGLLVSCQQTRHTYLPVPAEYGAREYRDLSKTQKMEFLTTELGYTTSTAFNIITGQYRVGMTKQQVIYSIGRPDKTTMATGSWGSEKLEQWIYYYDDKTLFLHFEVDRLDNWVTKYK